MPGPLAGILVLDLTQQLVGPGSTMLLGDMGADIVHVEPPLDPSVANANPAAALDRAGRMRAAYNFNRNKRSISIDLTTEAGREIVYDLARRADVCIQNYRPGVAARLKLEYEDIASVNPSIVYCEISSSGFAGSERHRVGFDIIAQGIGGSMVPDWRNRDLPSPTAVPIGDVTGMCLAALGVVAALHHRQRTGEGQRIQTSMLDGVVLQNILRMVAVEDGDRDWRDATIHGVRAMSESAVDYGTIVEASATGIGGLPTDAATGVPISVYYRAYRTADGFVVIGCLNLNQQRRLNDALSLGDPRFEPGFNPAAPEALERAAAMQPRAEEIFRSRSTDEWITFLDDRSIACGRVLNTLELFDHPHHRANQMVVEYEDPWVGTVKMLGHPLRFSSTPMSIRTAASPTGHETDEVLRSIGYTETKIGQLHESAVVHGAAAAARLSRQASP